MRLISDRELVRSHSKAIVALTCRAEGCPEAVWDSKAGLCILHSSIDDKPGFWDVLKRQHETRLAGEIGRQVDLSLPLNIPRDTREKIQIRIERIHFPSCSVPEWLFGYPAMITNCSFAEMISFHKIIFNRQLLLTDSVFNGPVDFSECQFGLVPGKFHNCTFAGDLILNACGVGRLNLHRCVFGSPFSIMGGQVRHQLSLTCSHLKGRFDMEGVVSFDSQGRNKLRTAVFFEDTRFTHTFFGFGQLDICTFSACQWDLTGRRPNQHITTPSGYNLGMQEEQHRQMRRHFAREGHTLLTNEFALSEMESRRLQLKSGSWPKRSAEFWVLTFHKYLSFYNMRYLRPLFWLLVLLLLLPPLHLLGGFEILRSNNGPEFVRYTLQLGGGAGTTSATFSVRVRDCLEALNFAVSSMMIRSGGEYTPASTLSSVARTLGQVLGPALVLVFVFSLRRRLRLPSGID